ncbi:MAG TPA: DUF1365 domain-containing protein [Rhizomicrobium sp.]|nr:DUF1365 domain-containing protein [Rhizomicrobium sp.]
MASEQPTPHASALYEGWVMHRRLRPKHHRFQYRVFAMLLEMDELAALDRKLALFKYNRWGLFSFQDRDHGDGRPVKLWLDDLLTQNGVDAKGARRVLCYPRILGFVFNPISVWFCDDEQGRLKAIVYEVHNTYEERHAYVLPVPQAPTPGTDLREHRPGTARPDGSLENQNGLSSPVGRATQDIVRHDCTKNFYVSPFLSRDCRYQFRIRPPGQDVAIVIQEEEAGAPILNASFAGARRALSDRMLVKMLLRYPLMTLKVVAAIHFEAVRLMLKGMRRHPHQPKAVYIPAE